MAPVSIARGTELSDGSSADTDSSLGALGKDPRLTVITADPLNVETPLSLLETPLTPIERMFMRNHEPIVERDARDWSLTIDGLVRHPLTIFFNELLDLPRSCYAAVLECSGNGRRAFAQAGTPAEGLPWGQGAVACAEWIGVPVALLLERAGVKSTALQAECSGDGPEPFVRGVEVAKLRDDAMLAYAVNGEPIPASHGGPVRLVVPGWGGVNWVKGLTHMRLISHESRSEQNQGHYVLYNAAGQVTGKVRELLVKSIITGPTAGATLAAGPTEVRGWAWSSGRSIVGVEVSVDGGASWHEAKLGADLGPRAWRGFHMHWNAKPGRHTLLARASDSAGATQPIAVPFNTRGYLNNAIHRIELTVE